MDKFLATRRIFLQRGMALLAAAPTIPTFLSQTVMALSNPTDAPRTQQPSGKDGKILVVLQFSGGNDGASMVIPYGDDHYYRARPTISHPASTILKLSNYVGLHPELTELKKLYDDGTLGVVQGVGYPNPNRSHFRSMDIWQSAEPQIDTPSDGWLGRYFDNNCPGMDPHVGIAMGDTLPLAMQGNKILPLSFERPESYRYNGRDKQHYLELNQSNAPATPKNAIGGRGITMDNPAAPSITPQTQLDFLHRTAMDAQASSDQILRITRDHQTTAKYPDGEFGDGLRTIAAMIGGGMTTRVYYVSMGGFDTHVNQLNRHDQLMKQLNAGLGAFWQDIKQQKNDDRVLLMTFSEFGRRVQQNASGGTDHGAAAPMFVMGPKLQQGLIGNYPSLTNLDQGDLRYNVDFRSVYASILQNWLGTASKPILGNQFPVFPIVKA